MITLTIALRYLLRRKVRMAMIGLLVVLGTMVIVLGETFSLSAKHFSRDSIISYFTGDLIIYAARSKEKPSPFAFTTPLPVITGARRIEAWLDANPLVDCHVAIAQNYGLLSMEKRGKKTEVPFFFYAIDPVKYRAAFPNISMVKGAFYATEGNGPEAGVVLSKFQVDNYSKNYSLDLAPGDRVTLLSLTDGGSVNACPSQIIGVYDPKRYKNVFNYINFLDITSYSRLYNFTGVDAASLPSGYSAALASGSDDEIFGLSGRKGFGAIETKKLVSRELTGYTMIAVKLKNRGAIGPFTDGLGHAGFDVKIAPWNEASSFFANVAGIIQAVIYGATLLIFLIVVFILMNTLIISVLERTGEVGTLRAMGGEKSFITAIFLWEALLLNGSAALTGMLLSLVVILAVGGSGGVQLPDIMAQYLVGGGKLDLVISARPFIEALTLVLVVCALATIYPIRVAIAITPLKAMAGK
ncbi:MAG: FtsX-like permease family protein [Chitinivibrionales bacterium]